MTYRFEVTRGQVLETFVGNELQDAQNYDAVVASQGQSATAIARMLGLHKKKVARYLNGSKPRGLKCIDRLVSLGLFPLGLDKDAFAPFHTLSSMVYWRGLVVARNEGGRNTFSNTVVNPTTDIQRGFAQDFFERLGVNTRNISKGGISVPAELSRVLVASGHVIGAKSHQSETVPSYIRRAIESDDDNPKRISLIREFISSMVLFRVKDTDMTPMAHLYTLHDREAADVQLELICRAVKIAFPRIASEGRGPYESEDTFHTRIAFPRGSKAIAAIRANYIADPKIV